MKVKVSALKNPRVLEEDRWESKHLINSVKMLF